MRTIPLALAACLALAVVLAGCASNDGNEATNGDQSGRELNTDMEVENSTDNSTMETNESDMNETTSSGG